MKRLLLSSIVCLVFMTNVVALECNLCGTWSGTYTTPNNGQWKMVLRINKYETKYRIRVKKSKIENGDTYYENNCNIMSYSKDYIKWYIETPMKYDNDDKMYIQSREYFSISFVDGILLYSHEGSYDDYYNQNKQYIKRISIEPIPFLRNIELFNEEEGDW